MIRLELLQSRGQNAMTLTRHPRRLARIAGVFYLVIIAAALFAYLHVRGQLIHPGDMARTAADLVANEPYYRIGFSAAVVVVLSNLPVGMIFYELFKIVDQRLALQAMVFIIVSTTIEAMNAINYIAPLFTFTLAEYRAAFSPEQLQALARGSIRTFGYTFSLSLAFFGVFCALTGTLILRSRFLPKPLGILMIAAAASYWLGSFGQFLALPDIPYVSLIQVIAEGALALWLVAFGVNEANWRAQAQASPGS